jgi:diacylglycerol kinase (ATP)
MNNGRYKIIVNPTAGRGNGARVIPSLEASLRKYGLDFDLEQTQAPGHAIDLAREAAVSGYSIVVGVGGDGTANEVVNGLVQATENGRIDVTMGALGAGRGNDFAFGIGMPAGLDEGCRVLAEGRRREIDIGHVQGGIFPDGRYFGNSLGIGFDAVVSMEAMKMTRLSGVPSYLVAVLKTVFLYYHAPQVLLNYDGQELALPALMISIMNGRRQGGTFIMSPDAHNDDGLFDLCIVRGVSRPRIFTLIPHFLKGSQFSQKEVQFRQAGVVICTAVQGALPAHLDGEIMSVNGTNLAIKILPRRLQVICPPPVS